MKKIVGIIGGRKVSKEILKIAEKVGKLIAEKDALLICGGLGGVMEAAAKGAKIAGGITIGILPQNNCEYANPYIDIPIATGLGIARNVIITNTADVFIAIGGEYGTLSEIAFALQMEKPVIGIKTWDIKGIINVSSAEEAVKTAFEVLKKFIV